MEYIKEVESFMQMGNNIYNYENWRYGRYKNYLINDWLPNLEFTEGALAYYLEADILDIDFRFGEERDTLLHLVLKKGRNDLAYMLVTEYKANINAKNLKGETPLFIILNNKFTDTERLQLIRILLRNGLDLHLKVRGKKQGDLALSNSNESIREIVRKKYNYYAKSLLKGLHIILYETINKDKYIIQHKISEILTVHTLTYLYII